MIWLKLIIWSKLILATSSENQPSGLTWRWGFLETLSKAFVLYEFERVFVSFFRTYDALVGVSTHDFFDSLSELDIRRGVTTQQRDRMLQTFVRNQYSAHLQEILLTLQNEYTDWDKEQQTQAMVKEQVRQRSRSKHWEKNKNEFPKNGKYY